MWNVIHKGSWGHSVDLCSHPRWNPSIDLSIANGSKNVIIPITTFIHDYYELNHSDSITELIQLLVDWLRPTWLIKFWNN